MENKKTTKLLSPGNEGWVSLCDQGLGDQSKKTSAGDYVLPALHTYSEITYHIPKKSLDCLKKSLSFDISEGGHVYITWDKIFCASDLLFPTFWVHILKFASMNPRCESIM